MLTGRRFGGTPRIERPPMRMSPSSGARKPAIDPQQRRLAAARRPEDREEAAVRDRERQRVDGGVARRSAW